MNSTPDPAGVNTSDTGVGLTVICRGSGRLVGALSC
jgi:hypothetical protein